MSNRVLVTGATGRIGSAVTAQLLDKGVTTRAMVHRDDARSARLRDLGAEVVVADMFDIQQVSAANVTGPESRRTADNFIRQAWNFVLTGLVPMHRLDEFDRIQQHPAPAHPRLSGQSPVRRNEHTAVSEPERTGIR